MAEGSSPMMNGRRKIRAKGKEGSSKETPGLD
jgi:hypothetical protein